jgi:hypothetical protein
MRRRAEASVITFSSIAVMMLPGPMAFTRMPCGASAMAIALVSWEMPPLEME